VLDLLDGREMRDVDLVKTAAEPREGPDVRLDGRPAQIVEEVVMEMDAIQAGLTGEHLVQVREVVVDEVRKRLRWVHTRSYVALEAVLRGARILPMVQ
jgi:hypothetical protein